MVLHGETGIARDDVGGELEFVATVDGARRSCGVRYPERRGSRHREDPVARHHPRALGGWNVRLARCRGRNRDALQPLQRGRSAISVLRPACSGSARMRDPGVQGVPRHAPARSRPRRGRDGRARAASIRAGSSGSLNGRTMLGSRMRRHRAILPAMTTALLRRLTHTRGPAIDRARVKAVARLDGKFVVHTNCDTLSAEGMALGYRQLRPVTQG